jgi:hypothetical protein
MKKPCGSSYTVNIYAERDERGNLQLTPHFAGERGNCIAGDELAKINAMINAEAVLKTDGGSHN